MSTDRVVVDHDRCVAAGNCASLVPRVFAQSDDGKVILIKADIEQDLRSAVDDAADLCPGMAIEVTQDR